MIHYYNMATKKENKKTDSMQPVAIDKNMRDYSKDPVFMKKHAEASAFIKRVGLPSSFTKKHK
jgi:hypothetical protein